MRRSVKKIVFVEPKSTHLHVYSRIAIPRLGSVLLATIMRNKGYDVRVYIEDIAPVDMEEVLSADLVGISALTSTAPQSYLLADRVRAAGIPVVLGGTHCTFLSDEAMEHADFVVRGEGEHAFQELVDALQAGTGFESIQNLSYREGGPTVHNPERPKIANLDINPIPDFHLITGWKPGGVVSIATSRGCPFSCTFCSVPGMYGHVFRTNSIERVLEELAVHREASYVFFADDIFTANKKRVKELLSRMIQRGLTPEWGAQVRTETVDDDELLGLMRDSRCFNVYVGFESINPRTLELFKKKQDLAKIERAIDKFHRAKISIHGMFVVGSDEDDVETIEVTAKFAKEKGIDSVQFMILTPIPGSPDWDQIYARGNVDILTKDWSLYDGHHVVHQPRRMSPYELQMAAIKGMQKFYSLGGVFSRLMKGDKYYAAIRFFGRKMIKEWWKDQGNARHVAWLKDQLFAEAERLAQVGRTWRKVGVPEIFIQDKVGALLKRFLGELGVQVVPVAAEAAEEIASAWRKTADAVIMPIVNRAAKGQEELYAVLQQLQEAVQSNVGKLPQVVRFPVNLEQGPVFEAFAKVGLIFTSNMEKIRTAYRQAGLQEGFWEHA